LTATRPEYLPQLDGLRAFAVFAVMLHHFLPLNRVLPEDFVTLGSLGVRLFFVLSGFLITGILLRCRQRASDGETKPSQQLRRFYVRRFLRIFPVYYVTLGIVALLNLPTVRESFFWHVAYLSNFLFSFLGRFEGPLSHFWSLAVEEQFYLLWPWLIVFAPRRFLHGIILMTVISAPVFR
jgi:peptidoglycan/LPS O-acetylase OafA/YrhL